MRFDTPAEALARATIGDRAFGVIAKNAGVDAAVRAAYHRVLAEQYQERVRWRMSKTSTERS
jgi:hypothetical protein